MSTKHETVRPAVDDDAPDLKVRPVKLVRNADGRERTSRQPALDARQPGFAG
jgi:hypothetical protein